MKTLLTALFAALFGLTTTYAVASPVSGIVAVYQSDDEKKTDEEKKEEQKASTADGDERENTEEKKSD
jgi:hypothetical protein